MEKRTQRKSIILSVVLCLVVSAPAWAQTEDSGIYLSAGAGYFFTDDEDGNLLSGTLTRDTAHFSHSDEGSYNFAIGYQFNSSFSADIAATVVNGISLSGPYSENGVPIPNLNVETEVDSLYVMANIYWNFVDKTKLPLGLKPYVGIGAGVAKHTVDTLVFSEPGVTVEGGEEKDFAYSLSAGVRKEILNHVDVDLRYSYFDGGTAESGTFAVFPGGSGHHPEPVKIDMKANVWSFNLIYKF